METSMNVPQLLVRLSLATSFITPVCDRLGILGPFGSRNIEWGGWERFIDYTSTLMPFLERPMVNIMGATATVAEALIAIMLIIGFKIKIAALSGSILTMTFIICMTLFVGIKAPINYAVFTTCFASFMLFNIPQYKWSLDYMLQRSEIK